MRTTVEITTADIKALLMKKLQETIPDVPVDPSMVTILVKTKQNFRAEWEEGEFRATVTINEQIAT